MALNSVLGKLLFGKKPKLPDLKEVSLQEEQKKSIEGNRSVLPELMGLAREVNAFNQEETMKAREASLPGYKNVLAKTQEQLMSQLKGEIPKDVQDLIQNQAAARSLGGGYGGSGASRNLVARDLGLTSLGIVDKGLAAADRWLTTGSRFLTGPTFDVTSAFITPMQQAGFTVNERNTRWNYQWFKNQLDAQPEPWQQAIDQITTWLESSATSYAGMAMGGGGGGGKTPPLTYDIEGSTVGGGTGPMGGSGMGRNAYDFEAGGFYGNMMGM
jgi:hypothetical protein